MFTPNYYCCNKCGLDCEEMVMYKGMWLHLVECAYVCKCLVCEVKDWIDLELNQGFSYKMNLRCKVLNLNRRLKAILTLAG